MALTDEGLIEAPGMLSRWVRLNQRRTCALHDGSGENGPAVVLTPRRDSPVPRV